MKVDCKNWYNVTLFHDGFLDTLTGIVCHCLPLHGFACRARSFTSHLREITNSSHHVKVGMEVFGSAIQVGAQISFLERRSDYLPVLPLRVIRLTFAIYLWYDVPGRKI